jgi:hypothetical protein
LEGTRLLDFHCWAGWEHRGTGSPYREDASWAEEEARNSVKEELSRAPPAWEGEVDTCTSES